MTALSDMSIDHMIKTACIQTIMLLYIYLSQIRYLLVVILELNSVSEVQYKDMMINR